MWNKINLEKNDSYEMRMEMPENDTYSVNTVDVLICYTTKDAIGQVRKHYGLGWFDHDGNSWYCQLQYSNKDKVHEYLAWAPFERHDS